MKGKVRLGRVFGALPLSTHEFDVKKQDKAPLSANRLKKHS